MSRHVVFNEMVYPFITNKVQDVTSPSVSSDHVLLGHRNVWNGPTAAGQPDINLTSARATGPTSPTMSEHGQHHRAQSQSLPDPTTASLGFGSSQDHVNSSQMMPALRPTISSTQPDPHQLVPLHSIARTPLDQIPSSSVASDPVNLNHTTSTQVAGRSLMLRCASLWGLYANPSVQQKNPSSTSQPSSP